MRHNFAQWLAGGKLYRGWARSTFGNTDEGIPLIENGIRDYQATGALLGLPLFLSLKAEALHLAHRTSEALCSISEAEALAERSQYRLWSAELHRLRGVFLAQLGAGEAEIEEAFCEAIRTAKQQKSVSLAMRAEASYAEYRSQKSGEKSLVAASGDLIALTRTLAWLAQGEVLDFSRFQAGSISLIRGSVNPCAGKRNMNASPNREMRTTVPWCAPSDLRERFTVELPTLQKTQQDSLLGWVVQVANSLSLLAA